MRFRQSVRSGTAIAALILSAAALPAQAQEGLRVIDASGHQIGVLIPSPEAAPISSLPDTDLAVFAALDRMMAREMAIMEAADNEMAAQLNAEQRAMPVAQDQSGDGRTGHEGVAWQTFSAVSIGGRGASCTRTVTMTSNGTSAPVVHTASTGGRACATLLAPGPVSTQSPPEPGRSAPRTLIPAVDMRATGSDEARRRDAL
ncbi:hypothetical protein [Acidomonas methanolica]|uniref:hypothetical protein n=1 Tax=Acidomonas methanolica TaxID=437 RepID=UPI00211AA032|nr:hypothetical protein [Acidomonas methanolica]MCQ9156181.1 hypothetical protein [Acidomonas methanolica]